MKSYWLNIWYFVGGAFFQTIMGRVLDGYGKVESTLETSGVVRFRKSG